MALYEFRPGEVDLEAGEEAEGEIEDVALALEDADGHEAGHEGGDGLDTSFKSKKKSVRPAQKPVRSVLYYLKGYEGGLTLTPVQLPPLCRISQVTNQFEVLPNPHLKRDAISPILIGCCERQSHSCPDNRPSSLHVG